ncbi:MAG: M42 family metallopeptidase [Bacillota bacterium]
MKSQELIKKLCETTAVTGYETSIIPLLKEAFKDYVDSFKIDKLGNFTALKKGQGEDNPKILIAAHMDEIGLMVKKIDEDGFIKFSTVGGIDPRTLPGQKIKVHGREVLTGVIGAMPPHLLSASEMESKAYDIDDLYIDTGYDQEALQDLISIGDIISIERDLVSLKNDFVTGKALDDRAGVLMMVETAQELQKLNHEVDVYFVATIQEEVGVKGAITSTYDIFPDLGIAIDVCHGLMPGVNRSQAVKMDEGPAIALGPQVHPGLFKLLKDEANKRSLPFQIETSTSPFGTDAAGMQIARSGVATALLSIPLRYMHTSVELISLQDVNYGAQLLARMIAAVDSEFLEGLRCY